jgi:outer membrane protein OmpA-like peptidoglycan-associated protein
MSMENVHFEHRSAGIEPKCAQKLAALAVWMNANPNIVIVLDGHAGLPGIDDATPVLSDLRVVAVRDTLVAEGVASSRIYAAPLGAPVLLCNEETELCQHRNRRVEILIGSVL